MFDLGLATPSEWPNGKLLHRMLSQPLLLALSSP
jgi:hypothetical protein